MRVCRLVLNLITESSCFSNTLEHINKINPTCIAKMADYTFWVNMKSWMSLKSCRKAVSWFCESTAEALTWSLICRCEGQSVSAAKAQTISTLNGWSLSLHVLARHHSEISGVVKSVLHSRDIDAQLKTHFCWDLLLFFWESTGSWKV